MAKPQSKPTRRMTEPPDCKSVIAPLADHAVIDQLVQALRMIAPPPVN
jgi:hypothetical protein